MINTYGVIRLLINLNRKNPRFSKRSVRFINGQHMEITDNRKKYAEKLKRHMNYTNSLSCAGGDGGSGCPPIAFGGKGVAGYKGA
jgi:hypothetical protein